MLLGVYAAMFSYDDDRLRASTPPESGPLGPGSAARASEGAAAAMSGAVVDSWVAPLRSASALSRLRRAAGSIIDAAASADSAADAPAVGFTTSKKLGALMAARKRLSLVCPPRAPRARPPV